MNKEKRKTTQDPRLKTSVIGLGYVVCGFLLMGCGKQQQYEAVEPICVTGKNIPEVMQIAEDVLAKMHFTIEKADPNSGYIRTRPLAGAQFFEFWRRDNVGSFNAAEANIHSIRRIVELNMSQEEDKVSIDCDARVYRLSFPEQQITSSGRAYKIFSKSTRSMQRLTVTPEQKQAMAWIDLGEDKELASEILKRISSMLVARRSSLDIEYRESSIE